MKRPAVNGLVAAGGVSRSFLARMPLWRDGLGPVKAGSFRVARRTVNSLHAGFAVREYAELKCDVIWLWAPDKILDAVARDLAAQTAIDGKMIVLCGSPRDGSSLEAGRARVASLNAIDESGERAFIVEGHREVMGEVGRLLVAEKRKLIELRPGSKQLYLAGVHLATHLVLPWIAGAVESLREAGFSRVEATRVVEALGARSLRAYGKAGRKAWSSPGAELGTELRSIDPRLAGLYEAGVAAAVGYFEKHSGTRS